MLPVFHELHNQISLCRPFLLSPFATRPSSDPAHSQGWIGYFGQGGGKPRRVTCKLRARDARGVQAGGGWRGREGGREVSRRYVPPFFFPHVPHDHRLTLLTVRLLFFVIGCLTSQQQASVSQGRICSDNFTRCHTEIVVADQTFHLTQSQYTDTGSTSPSTDPITPGAWQGSHWSANF